MFPPHRGSLRAAGTGGKDLLGKDSALVLFQKSNFVSWTPLGGT